MTIRVLLSFLVTTLAAAAGALGPWFSPFFNFALISDYFQPELNAVASVAGVAGFTVTFIACRKVSQARKLKRLVWTLLILAVCLVTCLILRFTVGVTFAPGQALTVTIWTFWIPLYVGLFVLLSIALCLMAMLVYPTEAPNPPADPSGS